MKWEWGRFTDLGGGLFRFTCLGDDWVGSQARVVDRIRFTGAGWGAVRFTGLGRGLGRFTGLGRGLGRFTGLGRGLGRFTGPGCGKD